MDWKTTLGYQAGNDLAALKKKYLRLALKLHPNKPGGSTEAFQSLGKAWESAQRYFSPEYSPSTPRPSPSPSQYARPWRPAPRPSAGSRIVEFIGLEHRDNELRPPLATFIKYNIAHDTTLGEIYEKLVEKYPTALYIAMDTRVDSLDGIFTGNIHRFDVWYFQPKYYTTKIYSVAEKKLVYVSGDRTPPPPRPAPSTPRKVVSFRVYSHQRDGKTSETLINIAIAPGTTVGELYELIANRFPGALFIKIGTGEPLRHVFHKHFEFVTVWYSPVESTMEVYSVAEKKYVSAGPETPKKQNRNNAKNKNKPCKPCPPDKICNRKTGLCVLKTGAIGRKILRGL